MTVDPRPEAARAPLLTIILPSFRDARIVDAIASIRNFDDIECVSIVVIDGASGDELVDKIRALLTDRDTLISEPDDGIFDGLNKGLAAVKTPFTGWLGSDDMFSGAVKASQICAALEMHDLFVGTIAFVRGDRVQRLTHSWPSRTGLLLFGLHNPHYATFGRSDLLKSETFDLHDISADQEYFVRIFAKAKAIGGTDTVTTLQGDGGFSNASLSRVIELNKLTFSTYRRHSNVAQAAIAVATKIVYKSASTLWFRLFPVRWPDRYTPLGGR